jgi:Domain of unknown function (DUF6471)
VRPPGRQGEGDGPPSAVGDHANKISRDKWSALFFVQCLSVIGCKNINLATEQR